MHCAALSAVERRRRWRGTAPERARHRAGPLRAGFGADRAPRDRSPLRMLPTNRGSTKSVSIRVGWRSTEQNAIKC